MNIEGRHNYEVTLHTAWGAPIIFTANNQYRDRIDFINDISTHDFLIIDDYKMSVNMNFVHYIEVKEI